MDLAPLKALCLRYNSENAEKSGILSGFSVLRRETPSGIEAVVYEPVLCLILQGSKETAIGNRVVKLRPGDALLVSHDLPVVSRITEASAAEPYLAAILSLDLSLVRSLYDQLADMPAAASGARSLEKARAEPAWLDPLIRYAALMGHPLDARVLGPSIRREIHYRLLLSPLGEMLKNLLVTGSHASRIEKAIRKLRAEFRAPLSMADLAKTAGMSASSFHQHFKAVTGTTPLQYQKDLRLIEARNLLAQRTGSVSETAYAVGYESPTHFSRDFSRKFGLPPSRGAVAGQRVGTGVSPR